MKKLKIFLLWLAISVITGFAICGVTKWEWYKCVTISVIAMSVNFLISYASLYLGILSKKIADESRAKKV